MNTEHHPFSPGLLVSMPPESHHALHLDDEGKGEEFDWDAEESSSLFRTLVDYLKSLL